MFLVLQVYRALKKSITLHAQTCPDLCWYAVQECNMCTHKNEGGKAQSPLGAHLHLFCYTSCFKSHLTYDTLYGFKNKCCGSITYINPITTNTYYCGTPTYFDFLLC